MLFKRFVVYNLNATWLSYTSFKWVNILRNFCTLQKYINNIIPLESVGHTKVYLISYCNYTHLIFVPMSATIEIKLLKPKLNTHLGTVNYTSILALGRLSRRWVWEEQIVWAQSGLHSKPYCKKNHFKAGLSQLSWHKFKVWRQNLEGNM